MPRALPLPVGRRFLPTAGTGPSLARDQRRPAPIQRPSARSADPVTLHLVSHEVDIEAG